jgi:hypothetical protein
MKERNFQGNPVGLVLSESYKFRVYISMCTVYVYKHTQGVSRGTCHTSEESSLGKLQRYYQVCLYAELNGYRDNGNITFNPYAANVENMVSS